jgi:hypothetical protein
MFRRAVVGLCHLVHYPLPRFRPVVQLRDKVECFQVECFHFHFVEFRFVPNGVHGGY